MLDDYLEKYGLTKKNSFDFSKRNLVIGKNGSGKTRLLKAVRDYQRNKNEGVIYIYFPALLSQYDKVFEEKEVESTLFEIVKAKDDMSFDEFVLVFQNTGVSLIESYIRDLNSRASKAKMEAEKTLAAIKKNLCDFLNINLLCENNKILLKFCDERELEVKEALTQMSPGELNIFYVSLFLAVISNERSFILLMDEPEVHVHPSVVIRFYNALKNMECMKEIWIATHSPLLLQEFSFDEIILVSEGKICSRNSHLYENIMNEMLGERHEAITELFSSLEEWEYSKFIAECFTNPTVVEKASKNDEQALKFARFCEKTYKSGFEILDWGAGTGRLGWCLEEIAKNETNPLKYKYEIHEPKIENEVRNSKFKTYKNVNDISTQYDCVVLMNVLHEIGIKDWKKTILDIKKILKEDGYLVFAEAKTLSIGEQPDCENGYIVLGEDQVKKLFEDKNSTTEIASFCEENGNKSEFIVIPSCELERISEENIKIAIENLKSSMFLRLKEMDAERIQSVRTGKKLSFTYRKYAFIAQQFINATLALESEMFKQPKMKVETVREAQKNNDSNFDKSPRSPHRVRNEATFK